MVCFLSKVTKKQLLESFYTSQCF